MNHPQDTNYSIIRTTSKVDGTPIQEILDLYDSKSTPKFGGQKGTSQDGMAIIIDCQCSRTFAERVSVESRLDEFVFTSEDIPSYIRLGCEDTNYIDSKAIIQTKGESGMAWSAPMEV